jgi:hypothetical protein
VYCSQPSIKDSKMISQDIVGSLRVCRIFSYRIVLIYFFGIVQVFLKVDFTGQGFIPRIRSLCPNETTPSVLYVLPFPFFFWTRARNHLFFDSDESNDGVEVNWKPAFNGMFLLHCLDWGRDREFLWTEEIFSSILWNLFHSSVSSKSCTAFVE